MRLNGAEAAGDWRLWLSHDPVRLRVALSNVCDTVGGSQV